MTRIGSSLRHGRQVYGKQRLGALDCEAGPHTAHIGVLCVKALGQAYMSRTREAEEPTRRPVKFRSAGSRWGGAGVAFNLATILANQPALNSISIPNSANAGVFIFSMQCHPTEMIP
jgi:hypothetical protein